MTTISPKAIAFNQISEIDKKALTIKFDIAHFIATNNLAFTPICQLEEKHGVSVGAGKTFCHYIAESRRNEPKPSSFQS